MMTLDPDDQFFQEDDSHSRDDDLKNTKDNQLYKDTMALLKRKMCTAQDLLEQFNEKVKEHDDLNLEFHELKIDKEKLFNKYNSASEKLTRLELSTRDYEKSRDEYKCTVDKQKVELDEKKKHIEQLEFKIKEMEKDGFHLKDEIKKLQQEIKISKSKKATKDRQSQTIRTNQHDVAVNADLKKATPRKPQTRDKEIMTDNDVMPFRTLCSKCEKTVSMPPLGEILKIMSSPPPPSLSNQFSPPCSPKSTPSCSQRSESIASNAMYYHENPYSSSSDNKTIDKSRKEYQEPNKPSFMVMDQLIRRISNLERQVNKDKRDKSCRPKCCPSKNIKFVVQLANKEKYLEYAKLGQRKQTHVKRLKKKKVKSKSNKKSKVREWQVESDVETENVKLSLRKGTKQSEIKCKTLEDNNETDLFESPAILDSSSTPESTSGTGKITNQESLLDENTDQVFVNLTEKVADCDYEIGNECTVQSSISEPVLEHRSYSETDIVKLDMKLDVLNNVNETFDPISENLNDTNLSTRESDEIVDTKNDDVICTNIEEINEQANISQVIAKLETQENYQDTESTSSNIRRISISSTLSSEYDEIFSTTICTLTDKNPRLDIAKHESEQNSIQEVDSVEKTNILESNDQINSLAIGKIEKIEEIDSPESPSDQIENSVNIQMNIEDKKSREENEHSSDDSMNLSCRVAKNKKRGKCSNVIESDESSEETPKAMTSNRKRSIATKKRIISKINKLKKTSNYPITCKQTVKVAESKIEITDPCIPTKKQRIAHVPKDNSEIKQVVSREQSVQFIQDVSDKVESENDSPKPKPLVKRVKKTVDESLQNMKKMKLTRKTQSRPNDDERPAILDTVEAESISTGNKILEEKVKDEHHQPARETDIKESKHDENNHKQSVQDETANQVPDLLASQTILEKPECTENCTNMELSDISKDLQETVKTEDSLDDSKKDSDAESEAGKTIPARNLRGRKTAPKTPDRRISRRLQEHSPSVSKSDADTIDVMPSNGKKSKKKKRTKPNKNLLTEPFDSTNSSLGDTCIVSYFNDFFFGETRDDKEENFEPLRQHEKFIRQQLSIVIETEPLTTDVLTRVTDNLLTIAPLEVVGLVLVEYATTEYLNDVKCNTTYTPPAPPMTKLEQRLVTLITTIVKKEPEFMDTIEKGLQYKLFRLAKPLEIHIVERLFRILIVLNKIKKDRERVRMLLCDALYCYNTRAMNIIYIALLSWSEVFPRQDSKNDILVKTIVHIVMSSNVNRPYSKLMPLKRLLTDYYGYPNSGYRAENFKLELMDNLKENVPGVNTAIILLCKSKGPDWALEYIVRDLKKMIISQVHPSIYDILTLLGDVLRPFSSDNLRGALQEITDQLCEVLTGNPGSHDLQEGIVSCLLNIGGKFSFSREKIAKCVLNWQSNQELRQTTRDKFKSFLKTHNLGWWQKFVQRNFPVAQ